MCPAASKATTLPAAEDRAAATDRPTHSLGTPATALGPGRWVTVPAASGPRPRHASGGLPAGLLRAPFLYASVRVPRRVLIPATSHARHQVGDRSRRACAGRGAS